MPVRNVITDEDRRLAFRSGSFEIDHFSYQARNLVGWWPCTAGSPEGGSWTSPDRSIGSSPATQTNEAYLQPVSSANAWQCPVATRTTRAVAAADDGHMDCGSTVGDTIVADVPYSISCWFNVHTAASLYAIVGRGGTIGGTSGFGFGFGVQSGGFAIYQSGATTYFFGINTGFLVHPGTWQYGLLTTRMEYIVGPNDIMRVMSARLDDEWYDQVVGHSVSPETLAPTTPFRLGKWSDEIEGIFRGLTGCILDARMYDRTISQVESVEHRKHPYRLVKPRTFPAFSYGGRPPIYHLVAGGTT